MNRLRDRALCAVVGVSCLAGVGAEAQVLDSFVNERRACREAQEAGRIADAYACIEELWKAHGNEMDVPAKIATLQQMAELYIVTEELDAARVVYENILARYDNGWRPDDFEYQPTAWREVFVAAQTARGITGSAPGLRNIALLDFVVTSLGPYDEDLQALEKTLPVYITTRLQEVVEKSGAGEGEHALRVIPSRDREALLRAITDMAGAEPGTPVTDITVSPSALVNAGRLHAVHAFVKGSIILVNENQLELAVQMVPVEDVRVSCPVTKSGRADQLFTVLTEGLDELMACAFDFASAPRADEYRGPVRKSAQALQHLHNALVCQERDDLECAMTEARAAAELLPEDPAVKDVLAGLEYQKARLATQPEVDLPTPTGLSVEAVSEGKADDAEQ